MLIKGVKLEENVSLKKYNTYKIDAKTKYLAHVESLDGLKELLVYIKDNNLNYMILGAGSNVILDDYFDGVIIKLSGLDYVDINDKEVKVGAGTMMPKMAQQTINHGLTGLEWAINIPGSVGGSIVNNAGAYNSEMFDLLTKVTVLTKDLQVVEMQKEDFTFQYRHTNIKDMDLIVLEGYFILEKGDIAESKILVEDRTLRRKNSQPLDMPSAGSVFRNPEGDYAGRLIEEAGLKGKKIGGAQVSLKHANFIVNTGNATSNDIKNLIKLIKEEVKEKFNVDLILEQEIINWK